MNKHDTPEEGKVDAGAASSSVVDTHARWQRTAIAAYFLAEARGFVPGGELEDWLEAERMVDAALIAAAVPVDTRVGARQSATETPKAPVKRARKSTAAATGSGGEAQPRKKTAERKTVARSRKAKPGIEADLGGMQ